MSGQKRQKDLSRKKITLPPPNHVGGPKDLKRKTWEAESRVVLSDSLGCGSEINAKMQDLVNSLTA